MPTRRGHGEGSLFQRKDGRWVATIDLGRGDDGRRRRKVLYGRTRQEARGKLLKAQREHAERRLATSSPTVQAWLADWLEQAALKLRPSTIDTYRGYVDKWIVPALGARRLDRLEPAHIRRLYGAMRDAGRSDATIRQVHAILSRALLVAVREGKVGANVADRQHMEPPPVGDNPRTPLTLPEVRLVLDAAAGDPYESRWYAALYLGLRQGEALGLRWSDVDLVGGVVVVRRALQRVKGRGLVDVELKSRHSYRAVPMPPQVASRLAVDRARHTAAGGDPDAYVWTEDGKPVDAGRDADRWRALLTRADVPYVALHAARNTAATLMAESGGSRKFVAEILGHGSAAVTDRHYTHGDLEIHRHVIDGLAALIEG